MGDRPTHPSPGRRTVRARAAALSVALVLVAVLLGCDKHSTLVRGTPTATTPHATNGDVRSVAVAGSTVVVGGSFTATTDPDGTVVNRRYLMAFDRTTGLIRRDWAPVLDGEVYTVVAAADGQSVYVGGRFNTVDGATSQKVARISTATGDRMPFQSGVGSVVTAMALQGDRLYIGGVFTSVQGRSRRVAALDAQTGAIDDSFDVAFEGTHRGAGEGKIWTIEAAPNGRYLMVVGSFATVGGLPRNQVVKLDASGPGPATVSGWATDGNVFGQACGSFDFYVTDVAVSPDSSYFVITSTGGKGSGTSGYCDSASRWENNATGGNRHTWVQYSGGDSLYSVEITSTAVYVGGHQRWSNNSFGSDSAGSGAVETEGIASHDPHNGLPLSWNPGRDRGRAVWQMLATDDGLYVVSDTDRIARYLYRGRIAFFPLAGGEPVHQPARATLPVTIEQLVPGSGGAPPRIVSRLFDGTTLGPPTTIVEDASALAGVRAAFLVDGTLFTAHDDATLRARSFDGTVLGPPRTIDLRGLTSFAADLDSMLGAMYDRGRVFYTRSTRSDVLFHYFSFQQELVGAQRLMVAGGQNPVGHLAVVGDHVYWVDRSTRALMRSSWSVANGMGGGATVVSPASADGIDWRDSPMWVRPAPVPADPVPAGADAPGGAPAPDPDVPAADDGTDPAASPSTAPAPEPEGGATTSTSTSTTSTTTTAPATGEGTATAPPEPGGPSP